ncbi:hypothetical protein AUQ43_00755 [Thalassospira sp. MCCC 1A01148]|uniref:Uncharacterized protein n=2 Tax=Thalassospiraceae TaxID=2844866 RepID=A0A367V3A9_9PROT|nr:hypothetical protein AUQ43_00755 [Thalassospira sp. MCCC 1A01148]RCK19666.1 hypothetical protein TH6_18890 [Thalassospira profundimaris]
MYSVGGSMLVYVAYVFCAVFALLSIFFLFSNRQNIKSLSFSEKSSVLSSSAQVIFISLGSAVALSSLDVAILQGTRAQQFRTSEILEKYDPDKMDEKIRKYNEFMSLLLRKAYRNDLEPSARLEKATELFQAGLVEDHDWLTGALSELLVCGEVEVCNSDRIKKTVCFLTDDQIRNLVREPLFSIPGSLSNFVFDSRENMARLQRESCGVISSAIDYYDEKWRVQ